MSTGQPTMGEAPGANKNAIPLPKKSETKKSERGRSDAAFSANQLCINIANNRAEDIQYSIVEAVEKKDIPFWRDRPIDRVNTWQQSLKLIEKYIGNSASEEVKTALQDARTALSNFRTAVEAALEDPTKSVKKEYDEFQKAAFRISNSIDTD